MRCKIQNKLSQHCKIEEQIKKELNLIGKEVFLAAKLNEITNTSQKWKHDIRFLTSACRLHESLIKEQLPTLQEVTTKTSYSIYSHFCLQYLEYPPIIITYLNARTRKANSKSMQGYKRVIETLAFER